MKTYVIIPNYTINDEIRKLARNAVESIRRTAPAVVIVVVDDHSPEDPMLGDIVDHMIFRPQNDGFAAACNDGFRWAMSDCDGDCYIVCANNDIEVFPGWLEALKEQIDGWDNVAFAGLVSSKERIVRGKPISEFSMNRISEGGLVMNWMQSGALWMSKKSVLQKIGLFDEAMKRGGMEDWDIFLRARDRFDMRILMSAKSMFWHAEGATRWKVSEEYKSENESIQAENERLFIERWGEFYAPRNGNAWREIVLRR